MKPTFRAGDFDPDPRRDIQEEMEAQRGEFEAKAKEIIGSMAGKENKDIKAALDEAEIPSAIYESMLPEEKKEEPADDKPEEKKE